jgi:hypothetical protein
MKWGEEAGCQGGQGKPTAHPAVSWAHTHCTQQTWPLPAVPLPTAAGWQPGPEPCTTPVVGTPQIHTYYPGTYAAGSNSTPFYRWEQRG